MYTRSELIFKKISKEAFLFFISTDILKKLTSMMISRVDEIELFNIPKVELHCHLELTYRPETMKSWAIEDKLPEGCSDEEFRPNTDPFPHE